MTEEGVSIEEAVILKENDVIIIIERAYYCVLFVTIVEGEAWRQIIDDYLLLMTSKLLKVMKISENMILKMTLMMLIIIISILLCGNGNDDMEGKWYCYWRWYCSDGI